MTPAERHYVELMAEFSRRAVLGQRVPARRRVAGNDALLAELNRVGVNLNQIAHAVNAGRGLPYDMPHVVADLRAVLVKLAGVADGS